jgi:hypothetical protein
MKKSNRNYAKRITAFAAAIAMCLSLQLGALPASAALPSTGDIVSPKNIVINATEYDFVLKSFGVLECYGSTDVPMGYVAYVKVELQQNDGGWDTIKTWSNKGGTNAFIDRDYAVMSGYSYRLKLTYKAYDSNDNLIETITDYSEVIYY